ncbi:hypothetical protein L5515_010269 [Caenorhabditis briggsae]|uniref:Uncharacterized protein n=1 Tax=Caenorhabditis briggsae TaxID=6238 RepID=A0AAE9ERF6_CAEBR|nr:hypothetical protein L5515_010269 [Caenorhabditis briggsae]
MENSKKSSKTSNRITGKTAWPMRRDGLPRKTKSAVHEWGLSCSWHGVPHMAQSLSWLTILLWSVILVISAVLFVYLITITVRQYFSFQVLIDLNIGMDESSFPSITFCNSNPYKLSAVQAIPELEALLTVYEQSLQ